MRCNEPKGSYTLKIEGNQGTADTMESVRNAWNKNGSV